MRKKTRQALEERICRRLRIDDFRCVEIESKRRVAPEAARDVKKYLLKQKKVYHQKAVFFFDQFLDTPRMDLFRSGASLRLRYKRNGSAVYLQYKGPGFHHGGVLYRSEFSTGRLKSVLMEESHHDTIHFSNTSIEQILAEQKDEPIARAMRRHLGPLVVSRITTGPIISMYQKDKFLVDLGSAFLEPSLDRVYAFHISPSGLHPLSTFCEYENEVKAPRSSAQAKLEKIPELLKFDQKLSEAFDLRPEPLDKYHRCSSFFSHGHKH